MPSNERKRALGIRNAHFWRIKLFCSRASIFFEKFRRVKIRKKSRGAAARTSFSRPFRPAAGRHKTMSSMAVPRPLIGGRDASPGGVTKNEECPSRGRQSRTTDGFSTAMMQAKPGQSIATRVCPDNTAFPAVCRLCSRRHECRCGCHRSWASERPRSRVDSRRPSRNFRAGL